MRTIWQQHHKQQLSIFNVTVIGFLRVRGLRSSHAHHIIRELRSPQLFLGRWLFTYQWCNPCMFWHILGDPGLVRGAGEKSKWAGKRKTRMRKEPQRTKFKQTSSKQSRWFWPLIGARKPSFFSAQSQSSSKTSLILRQTICLDIRAKVSRKQNRSRDFFPDLYRSIALQSPYMQIRVKLFVLDGNATKQLHLHLDLSQSPSRHMGSTPHTPSKWDAKGKTDDHVKASNARKKISNDFPNAPNAQLKFSNGYSNISNNFSIRLNRYQTDT